jgi:protoheme IX farnesyltransferase
VIVTVLPYITGMTGLIYLAAALALGLQFTRHAIALRRKDAPAHLPMQVFRYSVNYLMWLFAALLLDHFIKIRFTLGA